MITNNTSKEAIPIFGSKNLTIIIISLILALVFSFLNTTKTNAADLIVQNWWPAEGVTVGGVQPFKGLLQDYSIDEYNMYWQVDGGGLVPMNDSYEGYPHKEANVDLTGWNWKTSGSYTITFVAKNKNGIELAKKNINILIPTASKSNTVTPATDTVAQIVNPLANTKLFVNSDSNALRTSNEWKYNRPSDSAILKKIADAPVAVWLGNWNNDITSDTRKAVEKAKAANAEAVLVAYNIPQRDCGSYSAGGSSSANAYKIWISGLANGIGDAKAAVILEPDALPGMDCLSTTDKATRTSLISYAVTTLKKQKNVSVYIDAGNSTWIGADEMAKRLAAANVSNADGFSLNVSGFQPTNDTVTFGESLSKKVNNKHFVIDTARNGNGSNGEWCNPKGRALGQYPTTSTNNPFADAYLWIKTPGESDGTCNNGPSAGTWWPDYALELGKNAGY